MFGSFYERSRDIDELLELVGLTERQKAWSENLSGGQQQRLAVALALVSSPKLVFLDEPTTGLDPQARRRLWEVVQDMKGLGTTVILTSHYMDEAELLCDRLIVVDNGKVIAHDSPKGLIRENFADATLTFKSSRRLGAEDLTSLAGIDEVITLEPEYELSATDATVAIPALFALAAGADAELDDLQIRRPNLEDVFLKLTGRRIRD